MSVRLKRFMERSGVLTTTQFTYRKDLGTCDALLCMSHPLQSAFESGQEARIVQIDFSAAFDGVNHEGILCKLCSVGIGGSVLSKLTQFLSPDPCTLWWKVVEGKWLTLCQECRREVFWAALYHSTWALWSFFPFWKISSSVPIGYAGDATLMNVVPSPGVIVAVTESLIRDLERVSEWCDLWGGNKNTSNAKTVIVSISRTMHPQSPPLTMSELY